MTFAIGWTPCVGPILGSILSLAGTAETVSTGVALLVAYSGGLALPFVLSSVALGAFLAAFRRFRPWMPGVERTAGALLVVVGVLVADQLLHRPQLVRAQPHAPVAARAPVGRSGRPGRDRPPA